MWGESLGGLFSFCAVPGLGLHVVRTGNAADGLTKDEKIWRAYTRNFGFSARKGEGDLRRRRSVAQARGRSRSVAVSYGNFYYWRISPKAFNTQNRRFCKHVKGWRFLRDSRRVEKFSIAKDISLYWNTLYVPRFLKAEESENGAVFCKNCKASGKNSKAAPKNLLPWNLNLLPWSFQKRRFGLEKSV